MSSVESVVSKREISITKMIKMFLFSNSDECGLATCSNGRMIEI